MQRPDGPESETVLTSILRLLWVFCPGHTGVDGNNKADRLTGKAMVLCVLFLRKTWSVQRCSSAQYMWTQSWGHLTTDHLEERDVGSHCSTACLQRVKRDHRQSDHSYFKGSTVVTSLNQSGASFNELSWTCRNLYWLTEQTITIKGACSKWDSAVCHSIPQACPPSSEYNKEPVRAEKSHMTDGSQSFLSHDSGSAFESTNHYAAVVSDLICFCFVLTKQTNQEGLLL